MATAHQMSTLTNSCVRSPINPSNGLSQTTSAPPDIPFGSSWGPGGDARVLDQENRHKLEVSHSVDMGQLFNKTDSVLEDMTADLANLSDDAFYQKLLELKQEHKKTLDVCEALYSEKVGPRQYEVLKQQATRPLDRSYDHPLSETQPLNDSSNQMRRSIERSGYGDSNGSFVIKDRIKDMSASKPPTGRPKSATFSPSKRPLSGSTVPKRKQVWADRSGYSWKPKSESTDEETSGDESGKASPFHSQDMVTSYDDALAKIGDMWDTFSVDDYVPPSSLRKRSNSFSGKSNSLSGRSSSISKKESTDWKHRVTIPQPFSMSVREANKEKFISKAAIELEEKRLQKQLEEEAECQKQFKATPVPAHVYMPLYDEIVEKEETRRRVNKQNCEEVLKSSEKPFKFLKREEESKKYRRGHSIKSPLRLEDERAKKPSFKAKPFPQKIFDNNVSDQMKEEEEYRKIRVQMRAEELLRESKLPPNMEARGQEYFESKARQFKNIERAKKAGIYSEEHFRPKINEGVPDFEEMHRHFLRDMATKRAGKEVTVCKPFNLRTEKVAHKKHRVYDDIESDAMDFNSGSYRIKSKRRPYSSNLSRSLSTSMDSIPARMNTTSAMRRQVTKTKIQKEIENELHNREEERRKRRVEERLKKTIAEKALANDNSVSLRSSRKEKLKQFKETERQRQDEYEQYLNDMKERVNQRSFLFERQAQENAKKAADRKFKSALKDGGIDEEFLSKKGSYAGEEYDDTNEYDDALSSHHSGSAYLQNSHHSSSRHLSQSGAQEYTEDFTQSSHGFRSGHGTESEEEIEED